MESNTTKKVVHPCRNCLIASRCKQKPWLELVYDCHMLARYLFDGYNNPKDDDEIVRRNIIQTFHELFPNTWRPADAESTTWVYSVRVVKK